MKTAIIGAGRNRNGIGQYIAGYFHKNGARVVSVLGSSDRSSRAAALNLRHYGIHARSYADFFAMVETEQPDTVVIASPSYTHYDYVLKCMACGIKNILCEKPFLWTGGLFDERLLADLFAEAQSRKTLIGMNTQWIFALPFYERLSGRIEPQEDQNFFMLLSPPVSGPEMIPESLPHVLSMLYCVFGEGRVTRIVSEPSQGAMDMGFFYETPHSACRVRVELRTRADQPRPFCFGFNGRIVSRQIDINTYTIWLNYDKRRVKIADPLALSVQNFIDAVKAGREPLAGKNHILHTTLNLQELYKKSIDYGPVETQGA